MKTAFKNAMVVSLVALASATAIAQTVKNGELSGTIISKSVTIPAASSANVYTTPAAGFFVLTQICSSTNNIVLTGTTMGEIHRNQTDCQSFTPGIVMPAGETLSCYNQYGNPFSCVITGILTKK